MCDNARKRMKNSNKEKGENIGTRVAACWYLFSQTYSPKPDTTQRNSKECSTWTGSHLQAGKAMTVSENNSKCRWYSVIRGMEKLKLLHSGTCMSTSTRHVTLKSPLLWQFPYRKLCDNDNRRSNYRLMNVLFCTKAISADFSKSSK